MMDKLQDDLRDLYSRQQADLGDLQAVRRRVMQAALADRGEPVVGRLHFAAGIAAVVLAALIIGTFAFIRAGVAPHIVAPPKPSPVPSAPAPITPGPPHAPIIIDADPLNASTGWALLSGCFPPMTTTCRYTVARTTDGGLSWSNPVQVGPSYDATNGGAPRQVHFVSATDGFVFGGAAAFATHDGGRTWVAIDVKAVFFAEQAVVGQGRNVWLLSEPCAKGISCPYEARSSVDGGTTWSSPYLLPLGDSPTYVVAFGDRGLLISTTPGDMQITRDGGATWTAIKSQCGPSGFPNPVATADGNELWEWCLTEDPAPQKMFVSENGGKSWSLRAPKPTAALPPVDLTANLVSPVAGTALAASDQTTIEITHNGGRSWAQVAGNGLGFVAIRFASAMDGWALDANQTVWSTNDGGYLWSVGRSLAGQ
jgi:photosystem II stability/assembly factor-like uncharacterized protein